jgi:small subunit ribosomal protein S8
MNTTDPIADMLTRIRNACMARKASTDVPYSNIKMAIAKILRDEGYIEDFSVTGEGQRRQIHIKLKYTPTRVSVINGIKRLSRPGLRRYARYTEIPRVRYGLGTVIISTPQGIMTGREARRRHLGGELLAEVW